ncbi:MAG: alpha-ketoglutarate-dependent dioxygenase AlkB [Thermoanaerobaculia bacterium]
MPRGEPPAGFHYDPGFLSENEERDLLAAIESIEFREVVMRGAVAKRTTAHFGWTYDYARWRVEETEPIPEAFLGVRERAAAVGGIVPDDFAELLVSRYPSGAGIGWHRDAPMFGPIVAGISLLSACTLRFRRRTAGRFDRWGADVEPRSLYLLTGAARSAWQHSIGSTPSLRYSLTFRTLRGK